jgi:hypothetical protein
MNITMEIVRFCAEEVERQQDIPSAVAHMVNAWMDAMATETNLDAAGLIRWGHLVRPEKNPSDSFRTCGVRVGSHIAPRPDEVPALIERWLENIPGMDAGEAYKEFQHIHPFRDGNGRVGKIVFNMLNGTLENPKMPPNYFGCINC